MGARGRIAFCLLSVLSLVGCGAGAAALEPPPAEGGTSIDGAAWPGPGLFSGPVAPAVGVLEPDSERGVIWQPWPATEQGDADSLRARVAAIEGCPAGADAAASGTADSLAACAQAHWNLYLQGPDERASLEAAILVLATLVQRHPDRVGEADDPTMFRLAVALEAAGDARRAQQCLHRVIKRLPESAYEAAAYVLLGDGAQAIEEPQRAIERYAQAVQIPPARSGISGYARFRLAQALRWNGERELALQELQRAQQDAEMFATAHSDLVLEVTSAELARR